MCKVLVAGLINILSLWRKRKTPDRRLSEGEHLFFFLFQKAFSAVQQLWGQRLPKEYGPHIAESMLSILYHIIKGEAVIKEKLGSAPESSGSTSSTSVAARPPEAAPQPEINVQHLQQVGKVQSNPLNMDTKGKGGRCIESVLKSLLCTSISSQNAAVKLKRRYQGGPTIII